MTKQNQLIRRSLPLPDLSAILGRWSVRGDVYFCENLSSSRGHMNSLEMIN